MAEITPSSPQGAMPPKPAEAAKVQPKKETVRINLPPKPTSAPTIKLPTLAPGAPPACVSVTSAAAPAASRAPAPPQPPASGAPGSRVSGSPAAMAQKASPAAASAAARPAPYVDRGLSNLDKGLAIAAAVATLAGLAVLIYLKFGMPDSNGS